jgi:hypothetical protein
VSASATLVPSSTGTPGSPPPSAVGGGGWSPEWKHWARHIGAIGHWREGAIRALCDTTVPLSFVRWKECTGADCPVPPDWGVLTHAQRLALADLIRATSLAPARCRPAMARRIARYQSKLEGRCRPVAAFASPEDEALTTSPRWRTRQLIHRYNFSNAVVEAWALRVRHRYSDRHCELIAGLLGSRSPGFVGEARMVLGPDCPDIDQESIALAGTVELAAAVKVLRSADPFGNVQQDPAPSVSATSVRGDDAATYARQVHERQAQLAQRAEEQRRLLRESFPNPIDLTTLKADASEPLWLVEDFMLVGGHAHLSAPAKTGKSLAGLWVAANLAFGRDPFTWETRAPIRVVYLDLEMTRQDLKARLFDGMGFDPATIDRLVYFQRPPMPPLDTAEGGQWIRAMVELHKPELVVIDTLSRVIEGGENDSDTFRDLYRHAGQVLKEFGVAMIRLDHEGHGDVKRARGSSAKSDDVDVIWSMSKLDAGGLKLTNKGDRTGYSAEVIKLKRTSTPPLGFRREDDVGWPAGTGAKAKDLDDAGVPLDASKATATRMLKAAGFTPGTATVLLKALKFRRLTADDLPPDDFTHG